MIGFENEIEHVVGDRELFAAECRRIPRASDGLIYLKRDGSLSSFGVEMVSHPMTYQYFIEAMEKGELAFMWGLPKRGWSSEKTTSCGLHFHVSKTAFNEASLYHALKFMYSNPDFIFKVSRRPNRSNLDQWANFSANPGDLQLRKRARAMGQECGRHACLNLAPSKTAEFRIFKGTLSRRRFLSSLEFVKCLIEFAGIASDAEAADSGKLVKYALEHEADYRHFLSLVGNVALKEPLPMEEEGNAERPKVRRSAGKKPEAIPLDSDIRDAMRRAMDGARERIAERERGAYASTAWTNTGGTGEER